jgi:hypothetical protein
VQLANVPCQPLYDILIFLPLQKNVGYPKRGVLDVAYYKIIFGYFISEIKLAPNFFCVFVYLIFI